MSRARNSLSEDTGDHDLQPIESTGFRPAELMSLLKHPLTRLGLDVGVVRRAARSLELAAFRRPYLGRGLGAVESAFEAAIADARSGGPSRSPARRLGDRDVAAARDLIGRFKDAFAPMLQLADGGEKLHLAAHARAHAETAEALARPPPAADQETAEEGSPLWREEAGETAARLFERLSDPTLSSPMLTADDYPEFYRALVSTLHGDERDLFKPFLTIEDGHVALVQAQLDTVSGLGFWFDTMEFNLEAG